MTVLFIFEPCLNVYRLNVNGIILFYLSSPTCSFSLSRYCLLSHFCPFNGPHFSGFVTQVSLIISRWVSFQPLINALSLIVWCFLSLFSICSLSLLLALFLRFSLSLFHFFFLSLFFSCVSNEGVNEGFTQERIFVGTFFCANWCDDQFPGKKIRRHRKLFFPENQDWKEKFKLGSFIFTTSGRSYKSFLIRCHDVTTLLFSWFCLQCLSLLKTINEP